MSVTDRSEEYDFEMLGGALCLDFVNTVGGKLGSNPHEHLGTYGDLLVWGSQAGAITQAEVETLAEQASTAPRAAEEVLQRALALRTAINNVFTAVAGHREVQSRDMRLLNEELGRAAAHMRVEETGREFRWGWEAEARALDRLLWPVARSAAELLVSGDLTRVRQCEGETCGWLFLDVSKNRSRRWCDMSDCGNRAKAKRHYTRKRGLTTSEHKHD